MWLRNKFTKIIKIVKCTLTYFIAIRVLYLLEFLMYIIYYSGKFFFNPLIKQYALIEIIYDYCNYIEICPNYSKYIMVPLNFLVFNVFFIIILMLILLRTFHYNY